MKKACTNCGGEGEIWLNVILPGLGQRMEPVKCNRCNGTGIEPESDPKKEKDDK